MLFTLLLMSQPQLVRAQFVEQIIVTILGIFCSLFGIFCVEEPSSQTPTETGLPAPAVVTVAPSAVPSPAPTDALTEAPPRPAPSPVPTPAPALGTVGAPTSEPSQTPSPASATFLDPSVGAIFEDVSLIAVVEQNEDLVALELLPGNFSANITASSMIFETSDSTFTFFFSVPQAPYV